MLMITIYSSKGEDYLPWELISRPAEDLEDCHGWQLIVNLMRWFAGELIDLFRSPIQLIFFFEVLQFLLLSYFFLIF